MRKRQISMEARLLIAFVLMGLVLVWQGSVHQGPVASNSQPRETESLHRNEWNFFSGVEDRIRVAKAWISSREWYWRLALLAAASAVGFFSGVFAILAIADSPGWFRNHGFAISLSLILALVFLACLVLVVFVGVQLVALGIQVAARIRPSEWAWYWQTLLFFGACIAGLIAILVAIVLRDLGDGHRVKIVLLCLLVPASMAICLPLAFRFLVASYRSLLPLIEPAPVGVAAGIALFGALIVNGVDRSAYSRAVSHEWRYAKGGGRYKDATNLDVWEHLHGSGTWKARIQRHRIVWAVIAAAAGLITVANRTPTPGLLAVSANAVLCLLVVGMIGAIVKR